jgi:hypothetical protein
MTPRDATSVAPTAPASGGAVGPAPAGPASGMAASWQAAPWLVSPAFDLLFVANVAWLLVLIPGFAYGQSTPITFWQLYFITTPHRWLTLFLVALDPDRRDGRDRWFIAIALVGAVLILGTQLTTGTLLCLLLLDYVWNGWHFASQHAGVLRIYARKGNALAWSGLERHGLRLFLCYVIARTAAWAVGWLEPYPQWQEALRYLDWSMLGLPLALVLSELTAGQGLHRLPKRVYLLSVCGLYSGLLLAITAHTSGLIVALSTAVAAFHAIEYLAIVTHYARQRRHTGSAGTFRAVAWRWSMVLACFLLMLGTVAVLAERYVPSWWLALNLWVALLHYAYDGMIWKLRRAPTAKSLGIE